jgi:hypothetical protein
VHVGNSDNLQKIDTPTSRASRAVSMNTSQYTTALGRLHPFRNAAASPIFVQSLGLPKIPSIHCPVALPTAEAAVPVGLVRHAAGASPLTSRPP